MSIENVSKAYLNSKIANLSRPETKKTSAEKKESTSVSLGRDSVDISGEAKRLGQLVENLKTSVKDAPDVRSAKVEEVKTKLKEDFYDKREVIELVAESIADSFNRKK